MKKNEKDNLKPKTYEKNGILIIEDLPPVFERIVTAGMNPTVNTIYAYNGAIYSPYSKPVPDDVIAHEEVHLIQQQDNPDGWWDRYIESPHFRLEQEVEAYAVQYKFLCRKHKDRNRRNQILIHFAQVLSGPVYNNMIGSNYARRRIKETADKIGDHRERRKCDCGRLLALNKHKWCSDECQRKYNA